MTEIPQALKPYDYHPFAGADNWFAPTPLHQRPLDPDVPYDAVLSAEPKQGIERYEKLTEALFDACDWADRYIATESVAVLRVPLSLKDETTVGRLGDEIPPMRNLTFSGKFDSFRVGASITRLDILNRCFQTNTSPDIDEFFIRLKGATMVDELQGNFNVHSTAEIPLKTIGHLAIVPLRYASPR